VLEQLPGHLELYLISTPCSGCVLHAEPPAWLPINCRISQNHAEDHVIFVDASLPFWDEPIRGEYVDSRVTSRKFL